MKDKYCLDSDDVRRSLSQFVSLLPISVYFNDELLSCRFHAWSEPWSASIEDWREVIEEAYYDAPLLIIPIYSPDNELGLQGVLWIPEKTTYFSEPELYVYIKRMFVLKDDDIIIPEWARFIKGVINSTKLSRIVSGNTIKKDLILRKTREYIRATIIEQFRKLRNRPDHEYWKIIGPHDDAIKGSATDDKDFMRYVWDKLRFSARGRKITIPDYIKLIEKKTGEKVIYQFDKNNQFHSAELVQDSTGIPVLNLVQSKDSHLIRAICANNDIEIKSYRDLAEHQFKKSEDEEKYSSLIDACAYWNIFAEARSFHPAHFPAVMIEDSSMSEKRDGLLRGLKEKGERKFAEEFERFLNKQQSANFGISFYLNIDNELINSLVNADQIEQRNICLALYNISFMAAYPDLKDTERSKIFTSITRVLKPSNNKNIKQSMLPKNESPLPASTKISASDNNPGEIMIFMITPFSEDYKNVELAVRLFFESPPYCFRVHLARDYTYQRNITANVKEHITRADAFVAELTDLNSNVLLELGAAIFAKDNSPIYSLRKNNAKGDVPTDIKAELYIPYEGNVEESGPIFSDIRSALEANGVPKDSLLKDLCQKRKAHSLTDTLLSQTRYSFTEDEKSGIMVSYKTIEAAVEDSQNVSTKTGLTKELSSAFVADLKKILQKSNKSFRRARCTRR